MTQAITPIPVDARRGDWPRLVSTTLNRLQNTTAAAGASGAWGGITGTLSAQTDLQNALDAKQPITITATAGEALSGNRAVRFSGGSAFLADKDAATASHAAGITTGAASSGAAVAIQLDGVMTEPSWAWSPGPVWLGTTGQLTQTIPVTGSVIQIGIAVSATKLAIDPTFIAKL